MLTNKKVLKLKLKIMKEFKITAEQIKENKDLTLKEYFKEVFEETHKIGFWYKHSNGSLFNVTSIDEFGTLYGYGFFDSEYKEYLNGNTDYSCACNSVAKIDLVLATEQEVFDALKKEAEKRGFLKGAKVKDNGLSWTCKQNEILEDNTFRFYFCNNEMYIDVGDMNYGCLIFENGKWAEIISQPEEIIELNGVKYKRID